MDGRKLRVNTAEDRPRRADGPRFAASRPERPSYLAGGGMPAANAPWGGGFGQDQPLGGGGRPFKNKGSRRGLRGRKRSLSF